MSRVGLCTIAVLLLAAASPATTRQSDRPAAVKPNIVLIVADDLGYGDIGVHGCTEIPTPNIDALAKSGVRCTNGYVTCPVCSPTRAGLLTGRYQTRFGHEFNPGPRNLASREFGLVRSQKTLAERMRAEGYVTGLVGKWHLGSTVGLLPNDRGFDEFFGFLGGLSPYFPRRKAGDQRLMILRNKEHVEETSYLTDAFAREAVGFIDRHQAEPFFLYLPFNAVHAPMQAIEKYRSRFPKILDGRRRTYAAMLSAMDDAIGHVMAKLTEAKLDENTLVIFLSDNGGPTRVTTARNTPLSGAKTQVMEGGIRVPFLMRWTGTLPAGRVYEKPVISLDIHPTVMAAVGIAQPMGTALDGVNLLPYLTGRKKGSPHDALFWRYGEQNAVREGDWKLVRMPDEPDRLFNLAADPGEMTNLAESQPARLKHLLAIYDAWNAKNVSAAWTYAAGAAAFGKKR